MSWGLISAMGHVAIQTTRFSESIADAVDVLGLRETDRVDDVSYLSAGEVHHELRYVASDVDALDRIGLVARNGDALASLLRRVEDEGLPIVDRNPSGVGIADGFSFRGPEGVVFEIYTGMAGTRRVSLDFGPDRYGHFNFHPRHPTQFKDFLIRVLDFRVSDVVGDGFGYFLRCNAEHHGVGLIQGQGTLHHHAWQVQSIAELGKLGDRLRLEGREMIWGPVRHGAGHNIASYYVAPPGNVVELYADLEQIYDDERPPIVWENPGPWNNLWSRYVPQDFRRFGLKPAL